MKTVEEIFNENRDIKETIIYKHSPDTSELAITFDECKRLMILYAKEAIKADRENMVKQAHFHIKAKTGEQSFQKYQKNDFSITIDKDSIINAPNIKLK